METIVVRVCIGFVALMLFLIARHDWLRLSRPSRRINATAVGYRSSLNDSTKSYAAVWQFRDETGDHEVVDAVYSGTPHPPVGTVRELQYPEGRPDLARVPRPLTWLVVYAALLGFLAVLVALDRGWID